jgi:organic hydroperoxide reductase OsmC/OhrA
MAELSWKGDVASEIKIRDEIVTTDSNSDEGGGNLGIKEQKDRPSSFVELDVDIAVDADTVDRARLEKLIQLAEENCTVSNTLRNAVAPTVRLVWGE